MPSTLLPAPPVVVERPTRDERRPSGGSLPPASGNGDGGGGGGGGGDGGSGGEIPFRPGKLAMVFVLFSLSVLFVVTLAATLMLRKDARPWPPSGSPPFPRILWANTVVLLASSAFLRRGVAAIARGEAAVLARSLGVTTVLGCAFLVGQVLAWREVFEQGESMRSGSHGVIFYWLTGLHGAHVVGGIVFLAVSFVRAVRRRYTAEAHIGVELCELYWHFLGIVWIVLVTTLFLAL